MDERERKIIESADEAFSKFLPLPGEVYFGEGSFALRSGSYPFLVMLKSVDGKIKGVTIDKGGASNLEGVIMMNTLNFVRTYTYGRTGIVFNYSKLENTDIWRGNFQAKDVPYIGLTTCKLLPKNGSDKRLVSLMGVEGVLKIIEESPLGDMSFR